MRGGECGRRGYLHLGRLPALKELNLICGDLPMEDEDGEDLDTEAALKAMLPGLEIGGCGMP
jgi:hypothetical protein